VLTLSQALPEVSNRLPTESGVLIEITSLMPADVDGLEAAVPAGVRA